MAKVTKEEVDSFIQGSNPMEKIIKVELGYKDDKASVYYRDSEGKKQVQIDNFYPFCWCKTDAAQRLYKGNRPIIRKKLAEFGIEALPTRTTRDDGFEPERMRNGYRVLFKAIKHQSFSRFMKFFEDGGVPIYPDEKHPEYGRENFIVASPVEQYMMATGKRQFKGFNDYNDLLRFIFDLETEGLDPNIHAISQIGCWTNKGFHKIIKVVGDGEERKQSELEAIRELFQTIKEQDIDCLVSYNGENFDITFIAKRLEILANTTLSDFTRQIFGFGIYKKKKRTVLKLGGEIEYFNSTIMKGVHVVDGLFAVRRSQAQDSNMEKADLKYVTTYSKLNKENRVYVPGKFINTVWEDEELNYCFNEENGDWYRYKPGYVNKVPFERGLKDGKFKLLTRGYIQDGYKLVSGTYIVERYLLDDLYETDKVEHKFNSTNFFLSRILPVDYQKVYTMGTASIWKNIMLAWSYEKQLAIPKLIESRSFTGGLSRTMTTGILATGDPNDPRCVGKLDYNSLYPSILLSFAIKSEVDITDAMSLILNYVLTERETYKALKKKFNKLYEAEEEKLKKLQPTDPTYHEIELNVKEYKAKFLLYDNIQLLWKLCGNSYFGSFGSGSVFPWSDIVAAEKVTCIGRMMFRLLCYHFKHLNTIQPQYMKEVLTKINIEISGKVINFAK